MLALEFGLTMLQRSQGFGYKVTRARAFLLQTDLLLQGVFNSVGHSQASSDCNPDCKSAPHSIF